MRSSFTKTLGRYPKWRYAFTLIEILVVIAIMAILLALAGMGASGMMGSLRMKDAIEATRTQIEYARQYALTSNKPVIIRIYESENDVGEKGWRSMEVGFFNTVTHPGATGYSNPETNSFKPEFKRVGTVEKLPIGLVYHPSTTYSSLMGSHTNLRKGIDTSRDEQRNYVSFVCMPDGRTDLPSNEKWTLTIVQEADAKGASSLPANYAALQLDPTTSRVRLYRP